jgi:hypothetical protein
VANTLFSATPSPAHIASGGSTNIKVTCTVSAAGPMTISPSNGYTVTTTQRQLTVGQTSDSFDETINGPAGDCVLTFVFQGSRIATKVTIS